MGAIQLVVQAPEFGVGNVPPEIAAKALGMDPDTMRNKMEAGEIDIGIISASTKKRGVRKYRNTYISPMKLWLETGYVWKGESGETNEQLED